MVPSLVTEVGPTIFHTTLQLSKSLAVIYQELMRLAEYEAVAVDSYFY